MKPLLPTPSPLRGARRQRGFTLVEMMVAVGIGLVVALGFAVSFVNLKVTFGTQDKLAQLQDNERLALTFLTSSIEEAGYFIDTSPPSLSKATAIPAMPDTTFSNASVAGQFVTGTIAAGTVPVTLTTIYQSAASDGVLNCQGATNGSTGTVTFRNTFYVNTTTHTLNCVLTSTDVTATTSTTPSDAPLISNVDSMVVQYGVDTDGDGSADKYLTANLMTTTALWSAVKSVRVTVNFINPNAALGAGTSTIPWTQTINLMNNR